MLFWSVINHQASKTCGNALVYTMFTSQFCGNWNQFGQCVTGHTFLFFLNFFYKFLAIPYHDTHWTNSTQLNSCSINWSVYSLRCTLGSPSSNCSSSFVAQWSACMPYVCSIIPAFITLGLSSILHCAWQFYHGLRTSFIESMAQVFYLQVVYCFSFHFLVKF